jgi:hypothetical protein
MAGTPQGRNPLAGPTQPYPGLQQPTTGTGGGITATITPGTTTTTLGGTGGTTTRRFNPDPLATVGQPGYDLFSGYDNLGQLFFNQHPDQAWSHAWSQLAPNAAAPWWNWGRQQENRYEDQYNAEAAQPGNANLTFSDFINRHAPDFRTEFDSLPANQRGVNLFWLPSGRLG